MGTILLKDGWIIDGTGQPGFPGHVLIEDDSICAVIKAGQGIPAADEVLDANGFVICPGFIDMHSHSDWLLPLAESPQLLRCLLEQGITTVVAGNCGFSPAPFRPEMLRAFQQVGTLLERKFDFTWRSMDEYLSCMETMDLPLNLAELVGHTSIRLAAADTIRGPMLPNELESCLSLLGRTLDEGACGLSFGLGYEPGMYSPLSEIEAFCRVARDKHKPVTVHLKALSLLSPTYPLTTSEPHNLLALREMLDIAKRTGIALQISHFIFVGRRSFPTAEKALKMVEQAVQEGVDVMFDAFPYMCGNTTITVVLPHWFLRRGSQAFRNPWLKGRLWFELETGFRLVGFTYKDFQVMEVGVPGWEDLNGLTVPEIAAKWRTSNFEALLRLCEQSRGSALMLFHGYSGEPGREAVLESVLSNRLCLFETDAIIKSKGHPNPAAMGTFPRILGPLVRNRRLFTLEDAIQRSTLASARRFNLTDRGLIQAGKAADLVIFNPQIISDTPPQGRLAAARPVGIQHVFINGKQVIKDGTMISMAGPGKVLRV